MENIKSITIPEIQSGYLIFIHGIKKLAKDIQWFEKQKYPKQSFYFDDIQYFYYMLNHVGFFDKDVDDNLLVFQQDNPGRFQRDRFNEEYIIDKADIYIGVPKIDISNRLIFLREDAEILASSDCFLNYSYKSFIGFATNALWHKWFKKEIWITGEPKGSTCSQITAKFYQKDCQMFLGKKWFTFFPCELAMHKDIELRKLIYL